MKNLSIALLLILCGQFLFANMPPPTHQAKTQWTFSGMSNYPPLDFYIRFRYAQVAQKIKPNVPYLLEPQKMKNLYYHDFNCTVFFVDKTGKLETDSLFLQGVMDRNYYNDEIYQKNILLTVKEGKLDYETISENIVPVKESQKETTKTKKKQKSKKRKSGMVFAFSNDNHIDMNGLLAALSFVSLSAFTILFFYRQKRMQLGHI